MARKRVPVEVREVSVEAIVWQDAQISSRERLNSDVLLIRTYGAVVHEDERQVILAHEHHYDPLFMREDMDYTKIPKAVILKRIPLGKLLLEDDDPDPSTP